ncbi:aldose 1-epimerase family protein YeaD [Klebsiella pneumoniae]|uniref:Aldose 1-epimerase family protein YeaD n=1 Tax=Klebsiella pneumoniae TaxID=573 RepID=A0A2X3H4S1_KLEPN|nr:aldose 1-epimerase family protein YeaD [Klebsiella pneumoniae]
MINKIFALPVNETISPVISRRQLDDLELIVIDHPQVKASVALQGAHLLSWKPAGEEEVLWLSNNTPVYKQGRRPARRRADLLALVWSFCAARSAVARLCPQSAMDPGRS